MRVPGVWPGLPRPAPASCFSSQRCLKAQRSPIPSHFRGAPQGGEGLKAMLPWPPNMGASEPPTRTRVRVREGLGTCCQVRGLSASGGSRSREKPAGGVLARVTVIGGEKGHPTTTTAPLLIPAGLGTGPGQARLPTLARGLECPGTQPGLVGWECVAEPVPLSSYRLGLPLAKVPWGQTS